MSHFEFEATPNPDALRILPGRKISNGPPRQYLGPYSGPDRLAAALLAIEGVGRILIGPDFVTVIREPGSSWEELRPEIALALSDSLAQFPEGLDPGDAHSARGAAAPLGEIEQQIEDVLDRWVRPLLAADGGEAVLVRFDPSDGTAWIRMDGACGGCPSGSTTLKRGIEQAIRRWVPEVTSVRAAEAEARTSIDPKARFRAWIAEKWG